MRIFSMLAAVFGALSAPLLTRGQSFPSHPGGRPSLNRSQPPARGLMGARSRNVGGKSPSRRDIRRTRGRSVAYAYTKALPKGSNASFMQRSALLEA